MSETIKRTQKKVSWCGKDFIVVELTVDEVLAIVNIIKDEEEKTKAENNKNQEQNKEETTESQAKRLNLFEQVTMIIDICTQGDLKIEDITKQTPSKIKELLPHIEEVNRDFFEIAGYFGIDKITCKKMIRAIFIAHFSPYMTLSVSS